jgi:hypothetical protein
VPLDHQENLWLIIYGDSCRLNGQIYKGKCSCQREIGTSETTLIKNWSNTNKSRKLAPSVYPKKHHFILLPIPKKVYYEHLNVSVLPSVCFQP